MAIIMLSLIDIVVIAIKKNQAKKYAIW